MDEWDNWGRRTYDHQYLSFRKYYRCKSLPSVDKSHLESGNKIFMPQSALDRLACTQNVEYPLMFELRNLSSDKVTHCGVLEFTAEEGFVYMPAWMMETMEIREKDTVRLKNVRLKTGTYMKLQPHTEDFLKISNPKAVLERTLRNFSCVTKGETILIMHGNKKLYINVLETKPSSAVCIIETDCEVDFAPPLDYKEPEKVVKKVDRQLEHKLASGSCIQKETEKLVFGSKTLKPPKEEAKQVKNETQEKFQAFSGTSYKLRR